MRKRELVPALIAAAAAVLSIMVILNLPGVKFFVIDLRIAAVAGLGFLVFKIYGWSRSLFGEMPP